MKTKEQMLLDAAPAMYEALCELEGYFEQRQDISYDDPKRPNEEMRHLTMIRSTLNLAEGKIDD